MSANDRKGSSKTTRSVSPLAAYSDSDNESIPEIECKLCDKTLTSMTAYHQHIRSKKHFNQMAKRKVSVEAAINKLAEDDDSDDEELNSKYAELNCDVCSKTFSGYKPYASHLHGNTHAKNLKKQALKEQMKDVDGLELSDNAGCEDDWMPKVVAKCTLCNKEFTSLESFQKHLAGSVHKKKLQQEKILKTMKEERKDSDGEIGDDFYRKCDICDKEFSGLQPYRVHMKSSVHKKALKRIEVANKIKDLCTKESTDKEFICKECEHTFQDPFAFQLHLDNNSHKKYEAKRQINDLIDSYPEIVAVKTIQNDEEDSDEPDQYKIGAVILVCKVCHTSFSGPQSALDHIKSKKHIKAKQERAAIKLYRENQKAKASLDGGKAKKNSVNGSRKNEEDDDDFEHV